MPVNFDVGFKVSGPIFDKGLINDIQKVVNNGLQEIAQIEGANKVKEQLWGPPASAYYSSPRSAKHGAHTRYLRRGVGAQLQGDNVIVVDAGKSRYGGDVNYAVKVEKMYHMYEKTRAHIERNKSSLFDKYILPDVMRIIKK